MLKYLYIDHKTKEVSSGSGPLPDSNNGCIWLFLNNPTDKEKNTISSKFKISQLLMKDYVKQTRSKRYSTDPLVFVMVDYFVSNKMVKKTNILVMLKKDVFITILPNNLSQFDEFFKEIEKSIRNRPKEDRTMGEILYEFLDEIVQDNYDVLSTTEEMISDLEKKIIVRGNKLPSHVDDVLSMKRMLFAMSRRFWATAKIIFLVRKGLLSIHISKKTVSLLDDVYDTFQHQIEILEIQREMLGDVLNLYEASMANKLAVISNDLNTIMKKLTSLTVIVLLPSLIAGIYGMNFANLPGASSVVGFWITLGIMAVIAFGLYIIFHKKKWV